MGWSGEGLVCPNPHHCGDRCHAGHYPGLELFPVKPNQANADYGSPTGTFLLSEAVVPAWIRETRAQRAGVTKALISVTGFPRAV